MKSDLPIYDIDSQILELLIAIETIYAGAKAVSSALVKRPHA